MNIRKLLVTAVLLAVPVWAWAQQMGTDGQRIPGQNSSSANPPQPIVVGGVTSDTAFKALRFDGDGNLMITDAAPAYTDFRDGTTPIIDDSTAIGMADSSVVINMGKYRLHALAIRAAGAPANVTIAVQVRFHLAAMSDSASIFPWYPRRTGAAAADTSANYSNTQAPSAIDASRSEFALVLKSDATVASKWGNMAHAYICLADKYGEEFWAPYISVRIRVLAGSAIGLKVYLTGTPL